MKIKVKDEMNNIKLKLNHQELFLIGVAVGNLLNEIKYKTIDVKMYNHNLFDAQEFEDEYQVKSKVNKMVEELQEVLNKIHPY